MFYLIFRYYLCSLGFMRTDMMKMGPNDVSHVVWALGELYFMIFYILINVLCYFSSSIYHEEGSGGWYWQKKKSKWHEMCRLGHLYTFFFSLCVFIILTNYLHYFKALSTTMRVQEGCDDDSWPKQCEIHCLSPKYVSFLSFFVFFYILTNSLSYF